jgi:acyl carrier protein
MIPSAFMLLDRIPMTPNGKVDRRALPAPQDLGQTSAATFVSPRAGTESAVADIWKEILRVDRVGADDNFFDLGGHSLLVVQLQSKLRERFQSEFSLMELFRRPTVSAIAEYLSDSAAPASMTDRARQLAPRQNLSVVGE